jgi:hypothetical protein
MVVNRTSSPTRYPARRSAGSKHTYWAAVVGLLSTFGCERDGRTDHPDDIELGMAGKELGIQLCVLGPGRSGERGPVVSRLAAECVHQQEPVDHRQQAAWPEQADHQIEVVWSFCKPRVVVDHVERTLQLREDFGDVASPVRHSLSVAGLVGQICCLSDVDGISVDSENLGVCFECLRDPQC